MSAKEKAIRLKNGQFTSDPRLDRVKQVDLRSLSYPVRKVLPREAYRKPRSYTWQLKPRLDQGTEGACFPPGTLVRLADGSHKPIEDLRPLDMVVTAEGNCGRVLGVQARFHRDGLVRLRLRGHNVFAATPEHPVLTKRGYIPVESLQAGDEVALTRFGARAGGPIPVEVDVRELRGIIAGEVNYGGEIVEIAPLPYGIARTADAGRLFGLYAAEGYTTSNKVVWCFGGDEVDLIAETASLCKSVLGAEARVQRRPNGAVNVVVYGKTWRLLFGKLVPGTTKHGDRRLSSLVASGHDDYLSALFWGWMAGDGHARRTYVEGISVSKQLALDMFAIAQGLGLRPVLNVARPSPNRHVLIRPQRYSITVALGGGQNVAQQTDRAVWRKVVSTLREPFSGWVYNCHVEGDQSYVADGIGVHNCVGFGFAHELAARPAVVAADAKFARQEIYWEAQKIDEWPGGSYPGAKPVYEGSSVLAGAKVCKAGGYYDEYRWALNFDDLVAAVGYKGPVVIGVDWYAGMFEPDGSGFIHPKGQIEGGHCTLVYQVRINKKANGSINFDTSYFGIHNSWGPDWGQDGRCKITFTEMLILWPGGDFCIPIGRNRP